MKKIILTSFLLALGFTGCGEEQTKTIEYYMQHENAQELDAKVKECKNNPGEIGMTPNCINASKAAMQKRSHAPDTTDYSKW
ncbi:MAG: EexN family lipoprotein [Sulfurovaceae bacterium]|nr:EexN family lipoprotein [Sulfurovaceae bacterium]